MSWKVLITARGVKPAGEQAQQLLREAGCEIIFPSKFGPLNGEELTASLDGMDAVLASLDSYSAAALSLSGSWKNKNHRPLGRGLRFRGCGLSYAQWNRGHLHARRIG